MTEGRFDNRFRHGKAHFEFSGPLCLPPGASGARFERVAIDPEIGPEVVVLLIDSMPFAYQLKGLESFELHLKCGGVRTASGPVLFLLWWIPPVTNGKPFAMYENILDAAHESTREWLRRASLQTHLHVILIGPGEEVLGLYEFENAFELDHLALIGESACVGYQDTDFAAAEREFQQTYDLTQLFLLENPEPPGVEEKSAAPPRDKPLEKFLIPVTARPLIDSAIWLAGKLLTHPGCDAEGREALAKALFGLARLPKTTPGLCVSFGFSLRTAEGDSRYWSVDLDETQLMWSAGGIVHGPCGSDSFTSFQLSLLRRSKDRPIGNSGAWFELKRHLTDAAKVEAEDNSDRNLWNRFA